MNVLRCGVSPARPEGQPEGRFTTAASATHLTEKDGAYVAQGLKSPLSRRAPIGFRNGAATSRRVHRASAIGTTQ